MNPIDLINFRKLNKHYNLKRGTIRKDKIPNKYKEEINQLTNLIDAWINNKRLYTKEEVQNLVENALNKE